MTPGVTGALQGDGWAGPPAREVTDRLGDDVPVVRADDERLAGGAGEVDPVHPQVPVVDDVEQVAERGTGDAGYSEIDRHRAQHARPALPRPHGAWPLGGEAVHQVRSGVTEVLGDLHGHVRVHSGQLRMASAPGQFAAQQGRQTDPVLALGDQVGHHRAHVPCRAVGGPPPVLAAKAAQHQELRAIVDLTREPQVGGPAADQRGGDR